MSLAVIDNRAARRLFLDRHALAEAPQGPARGSDLLALIERLGFVQIDSINTVERAHHMILRARRPSYKPAALKRLLEQDRGLFEHWTHDASVIPTAFLPQWRQRFRRDAERLRRRYAKWQGSEFEEKIAEVLRHIHDNGPVGTGDVGTDEVRGKGGWWDWHPSKTALEYLWRSGRIAVTRRDGFAKIYDLAERVYRDCAPIDPAAGVDWACNQALDRLGFATSGELSAFWYLALPDQTREWCARALKRGEIAEVMVAGADGSVRCHFARPDVVQAARDAPEPTRKLRILSPFDPALRDRARTERLFGFHYRIEVFVPEPQRKYGYYVFPVLEGDTLIGRVDARARRADGVLQVAGFWPEAGVRMGRQRLARLEAELARLARFAGCERVGFDPGWLRE